MSSLGQIILVRMIMFLLKTIISIYIYIYIIILRKKIIYKVVSKVIVKSNPKAPFSIASTPRCRGRRYSFPWSAPLYPWSVPYNAEC